MRAVDDKVVIGIVAAATLTYRGLAGCACGCGEWRVGMRWPLVLVLVLVRGGRRRGGPPSPPLPPPP